MPNDKKRHRSLTSEIVPLSDKTPVGGGNDQGLPCLKLPELLTSCCRLPGCFSAQLRPQTSSILSPFQRKETSHTISFKVAS